MMFGVAKTEKMLVRLLLILGGFCANATSQQLPPSYIVANSSMTIALRSETSGPRVAWVAGPAKIKLGSVCAEPLPDSVEMNGKTVAVRWRLKASAHHDGLKDAEFVYESDQPHLRLSWEWRARADFGPLEHRITVENLGGEDVWLPMIDSLRLQIPYWPQHKLRHLYVDKGADTPGPVGTHIENITPGYRWTGYSSTYAFPQKGEAREVIPA